MVQQRERSPFQLMCAKAASSLAAQMAPTIGKCLPSPHTHTHTHTHTHPHPHSHTHSPLAHKFAGSATTMISNSAEFAAGPVPRHAPAALLRSSALHAHAGGRCWWRSSGSSWWRSSGFAAISGQARDGGGGCGIDGGRCGGGADRASGEGAAGRASGDEASYLPATDCEAVRGSRLQREAWRVERAREAEVRRVERQRVGQQLLSLLCD